MPDASRVMVNMPASLFPLPAPQHLPAGPLPPTWAFTVNPRQVARGETDWTLGQTGQTPTRCAQAASLCTRFASAL